ncbi:glycosyltransferase family 32 protein [Nonomuraea sp. NPDC049714]|uniref:glycosyltransferase family 32 protein n=1 Tax=Nonomuraea sp. NPDC049714 TaxID=3364357 RepID=UPI0037A1947C
MPDQFSEYTRTWVSHHPRWRYKLWEEKDLYFLTNHSCMMSAETYSEKSDVARYEILMRYGGVYADTDFECLRPIDELINELDAFAGSENGTHVSTGLMGAVPHHPYFSALANGIPGRIKSMPNGRPSETLGPGFATDIFKKMYGSSNNPPMHIFPSSIFYPYGRKERHLRNGPFPEAYAVHHWAGSWVESYERRKQRQLAGEESA